jgi:hypothetical protein
MGRETRSRSSVPATSAACPDSTAHHRHCKDKETTVTAFAGIGGQLVACENDGLWDAWAIPACEIGNQHASIGPTALDN